MNDEMNYQNPIEETTEAIETEAPQERTEPILAENEPAETTIDGDGEPEVVCSEEQVTEPEVQSEPQTQETEASPAYRETYPNPFAPQKPAQPAANANYPPQYTQTAYSGYPQPQYTQPAQPGYPQPPQYGSVHYNGYPQQSPYAPPTYAGHPQQTPYAPPTYAGSAPQSQYAQPGYPQPPQYTQPPQYGGTVPPQPPYAPQPQASAPKQPGRAARVLMWIAAALIEAVIVGFAIYGIYALCTQPASQNGYVPNGPGQSQSRPDHNNGYGNGGTSSEESDPVPENNAKVQMGIVCSEMTDEILAQYRIDKGLIVREIEVGGPAWDTDLAVGDVIVQANGVRVEKFEELFAVLEAMEVGDTMTLTCYSMLSDGETFRPTDTFEVTFQVVERQEETSSTYPGA